MPENLFQKLEEKVVLLLTEVEDLRKENQTLRFENTSLKNEKEKQTMEKVGHERKLTDLISLLDSVSSFEAPANVSNLAIVKSSSDVAVGEG